MLRIEREAVLADRRAIASSVDRPLPVVTCRAKRAERAEAKGIPVALMRRMMIGDRRRNDAALFRA